MQLPLFLIQVSVSPRIGGNFLLLFFLFCLLLTFIALSPYSFPPPSSHGDHQLGSFSCKRGDKFDMMYRVCFRNVSPNALPNQSADCQLGRRRVVSTMSDSALSLLRKRKRETYTHFYHVHLARSLAVGNPFFACFFCGNHHLHLGSLRCVPFLSLRLLGCCTSRFLCERKC